MGKILVIPGADFSENAIKISSFKTVQGSQAFQVLDSVTGVKSLVSDSEGYAEVDGVINYNGASDGNNLFNLAHSATDNVIEEVKNLRLKSTTPQYAFHRCDALKEITIAELDITTDEPVSCGFMFRYCTALEKLTIKASRKIKVQSFNFAFAGGSKNLLNLDLSMFDTSALQGNMREFFNTGGSAPYPKLQVVDFSGWDLSSFDISTATNYQYAFNLCGSLAKAIINGCNATTIAKLKTILSTVSPSTPKVFVESTDASGNAVLVPQT